MDKKDFLKKLGSMGTAAKSARLTAADKDLELILIGADAINPADIRMYQEIFGIKITPIFDEDNPDDVFTRHTVGVVKATVKVMDGETKKDTLIVNGKIDLPLKGNSVVEIKNLWFANLEDAEDIARGLVQAEYELADQIARKAAFEASWLKKQLDEDLF